MNLQQLRYATEIEKTGSITKAAKNLYMGQPNLSKSIKELEQEHKGSKTYPHGVGVSLLRPHDFGADGGAGIPLQTPFRKGFLLQRIGTAGYLSGGRFHPVFRRICKRRADGYSL